MFERFDRPVKCKADHVFTTIWIPLASFKAARLIRKRFQYCPVGHHWTTVTKLDPAIAPKSQLEQAASVHDIRIP